jgi:hypothetical protein
MVEAVIQTGAVETRYRRGGQGPQLLLLATATEGEWVAGVIPSLMTRFRVFIPDVPADPGPGWLRGMIDGLGLDRPGIVAGSTLTELLARFLETDADGLERVALIHPSPAGLAHPLPAVRVFSPPRDDGSVGLLLAFLDPDG